jgi:hypothetical protein
MSLRLWTCEEAHVKPEPGLPAFSSIMSNITVSGIPTVTEVVLKSRVFCCSIPGFRYSRSTSVTGDSGNEVLSHVRGWARVSLGASLRTTCDAQLRSCMQAPISLCIRVVLTLVSSTLRDTSFKYNTWYSLNNFGIFKIHFELEELVN